MFTRDLYPHPHLRPLPASRDPRHLDKLPLTLYSKTILDIRVQHCLRGEGGGGGLDLCELENALEMHSVPRLVHDCRQAKILTTIGQHVKTFSSPQLMIVFQNTGKRSDSQHHG